MTAPSVEVPSFEEVYEAHAAFAWRSLRRMGVREADVADAAQEAFLVIHRRLPEFDGRRPVRAWIFAICVRIASDHRRRAHVRREVPTETLPEQPVLGSQDAALEQRRAREQLDRALDALDEDKRAVFVLYELEQLTMNEVAEAVGCPLQTAYSRLHAARKRVAQVIEASGGRP